jgi:molybdopterin converting factor small subunit
MPQTVQVRYYAQLRDALKTSQEEISLNLPLKEQDILERLAQLHPKHRELLFASRVALNEGYVNAEAGLEDFCEIDIISPVSGG